ncbi:proton-coupled amino acid transporter 4 [Clonorchis sinensis]|uniref:Proton-coupled amino acid transporter 4 n=1 Tax=Clonorchis sinensis TaxID=79923 RepID=G7Y3R3_CLOSI|nr:proton-coupled amino acid transporter 4 [Clonorchis sinensis]
MDTSDREPMVRNALREADVISITVTEEENGNIMTELEDACAVGSNLRHMVNAFLIVVQIGCLCVYLLFLTENIRYFVRAFLPDQSQNFYLIGFLVTLLLIPLCWSVDMRILARLSMVANIATMIGTILVLAYLLTAGLQPYNTFPAYTNFQNLLIGFSIVIFAFEGIGMVLPIENKMAHPKGYTDLTGVLNVGMVVVVCVCASVGFFGFLNAGDNAQGSITLTIPERPFWFAPIKPLFIFAILVSYLVQYYIPAIIFARLMEKLRCHREASEKRRFVHIKTMRVCLVLFTYLMVITIPKLDLMISLVGAWSSSVLAFVLPSVLEVLHLWSERHLLKYFWLKVVVKDVIFIVIGVIAFVGGTVATVMQLIQSLQSTPTFE